jgi:tetratricopeptide (TPR) repeat protein
MADDQWFRNTSWNEIIASAFEEKLRRARRKSQYLRIQASTLAQTHPLIALDLLDRYFSLGDDFDHAQGHVDRATAYLALGEIEAGIKSYEEALKREEIFPNLRTSAYLDLPYQIALLGLNDRYKQAMALIPAAGEQLVFPVDHFKFHATRAIIRLDIGDISSACADARTALEAATRDHSSFRYHPDVGLVSDRHAKALSKLCALCDA